MPNRPEFMALWLGVTRVGGVVALLNTHLTGPALAHCINVVQPRHIVVAAELLAQFDTARAHITSDAKLWLHGEADAEPAAHRSRGRRPAGDRLADAERRRLTIEDRALYIYTSGTTGLPKAANVNHYRLMLASHAFAGVMDTSASDRMYDCLPMYHTAGGVVATGAVLINGGSVVIRERFSAREFWDDIVRWDCTLFQYIGELCRYLLNSPPHPKEREHRLRLACGNGLRPEIWAPFKRRFRIPQIIEFYGATEGNVALFNFDGKEGAVGRIPWFVAHRFPTKVVRFDVETQQPVRNEQGFCIECAVDEPGEVIGKILKDPSKPGAAVRGLRDPGRDRHERSCATCSRQGDAWFRTGDLMRKDAAGYFYFVDRIGDTFRWKGENVSTTEVEEAHRPVPRRPGGQRLRRRDPRPRRPRRHGGDRRRGAFQSDGASRPSGRAAARICPAGVPAPARRDRRHRHLQAEEDRSGEQRLRPGSKRRPDLFQRPAAHAFVRLDGALYQRIRAGGTHL